MPNITQNNKIAVVAVSIFLVSFSAMMIFLNQEESSPQYLKSSVLEAAVSGQGHGGEHSAYFSETGGSAHGTTDAEVDVENLYRVLIGNFDDPVFVLEPNGQTKLLSSNFTELYGYKLTDMGKNVFFSYISPVDLPDFAKNYTQVIQSGKSASGVGPYRFIKKDGGSSVHLSSFLPVVDDNGKVTEVIGSIKDITSKFKDFQDETADETAAVK